MHIQIDYKKFLDDGYGIWDARDMMPVVDMICDKLYTDGIECDRSDKNKMAGEIKFHVLVYTMCGMPSCEKVDINVYADGSVYDGRWYVDAPSWLLWML